jgi:hypothetical protein
MSPGLLAWTMVDLSGSVCKNVGQVAFATILCYWISFDSAGAAQGLLSSVVRLLKHLSIDATAFSHLNLRQLTFSSFEQSYPSFFLFYYPLASCWSNFGGLAVDFHFVDCSVEQTGLVRA